MGVLFDCPVLARRLPIETERDLAHSAYRVELEGDHLVWITREGDKEVRYNDEPGVGLWKKMKVKILSALPIESLL
jgi:putative cardiolipin synthase